MVDKIGCYVAVGPLRLTASPKPAASERRATARSASGEVEVEARPPARLTFATGRVPWQATDWSGPVPALALEPARPPWPEFAAPPEFAEAPAEGVDPGLVDLLPEGALRSQENPVPERLGTGISLSIDRQAPPVAEPPLGLTAPEDALPSRPRPEACGVPEGAVGAESALPRLEWSVL